MWKPVSGFEGIYEISDAGQVRRLPTPWYRTTRLLKQHDERYQRVRLFKRDGSDGVRYLVHRLVYETFIGPIPPGLTVNHKNGNKHDNRASNLELATMREQMFHAYSTGLQKRAKGEARKNVAKLTDADIRYIRRVYKFRRVTGKMLGQRFGVSAACIWAVIRGDRWSHID